MASLHDRFQQALAARAGARQPSGVSAAMTRYGWTTRDLARQLGVSERTARRYRQQDRIPERRREQRERFSRAVRAAARSRQRARMERRGLGQMSAGGVYEIGSGRRYRYRTGPNSRVRTYQARIPASAMRAYWAAVDRGDAAGADQVLNDALAGAYGAPGLSFVDADDVDFTI